MEFRSQETLGIKNDWAKKWWCCLLVAYLLRGDGPAVAQYIYRMAEIANKTTHYGGLQILMPLRGRHNRKLGAPWDKNSKTNAWNLAFKLKKKQTQSNSHIGVVYTILHQIMFRKIICTRSLPPKASFSHTLATLAYIFEEPNMPCASFTPFFWIVKGLASKFRGFVVFRCWQFDPFDPCPWAWRWDTSHEYRWVCLFRLWTLFECQIQPWSQLITCRWH